MTVSFNKQQERIKVPFAALSAFVDPSVRFGLQFDRKDKAGGARQGRRRSRRRRRRCRRRTSARRSAHPRPTRPRPRLAPSRAEGEAKPEDPASKIVKLDSFRKK